MTMRRVRIWLVTMFLILGVAGCQGTDNNAEGEDVNSTTGKVVSDGIRTDPEPITSRYPALSALTSVVWVAGTLGDREIPGPDSYWIDAIVQLPEADHRDLHIGTLEVAELPEDFHSELRDQVPGGEYRTSSELRELFQYKTGEIAVLLARDGKTAILSTKYQ